ncbi:MAG: hypothetical protein ONB46_09315 [candidate division KSB1 bacterium]|nr:hypothetical protein [candidate division KSB1 bacterium]MDZ7366000.1 hypothetical protein [candidate division KSB1 bacterium]MDZ7404117.1 hypothetical protein [candidate division KSB1 bacterium]
MRTLAEDTSPEMEAVLIGFLRKRTPQQKLVSMMGLRDLAKRLMLNNLRSQFPQATERELYYQLNARCFGRELTEHAFSVQTPFYGEVKMLNETEIVAMAAQRLDESKIPYYIGGGLASIN